MNRYLGRWNVHIHEFMQQHARGLVFFKSFLTHPRATGAISPSSKHLAKVMASYVVCAEAELVIELGAGTGMITAALLNRGIPAQNIIAIESSADWVKSLRQRFPKITVIEGNAAHLPELLKTQTKPISTIISGLPLRSLSKEMTQAILANIPKLLSDQGRYIQFTYDLRNSVDFYPKEYQLLEEKRVWANIPPAKVSVYRFAARQNGAS